MYKQLILSIAVAVFSSMELKAQPGPPNESQNSENKDASGKSVREYVNDLLLRANLRGRSHDDARVYLATRIAETSNYVVDCQEGFLTGLTERRCLIGLKTFSSAIANKKLASNPVFLGAKEIRISPSNTWSTRQSTWNDMVIRVPYNASDDDISRYISYHLFKPKLIADRQFLQQVNEEVKSRKIPFSIEISDDLTSDQLSRGIALIRQMGLQVGKQLPAIDTIRLAQANRSLYEMNRKLKVDFDAGTSAPQSREFLLREGRLEPKDSLPSLSPSDRNRWTKISQFKFQRHVVNQLFAELAKRTPNTKVHCGETDELSVQACLAGLENYAAALTLIPNLGDINEVIIYDATIDLTGARVKSGPKGQKQLIFGFASSPSNIATTIMASMSP